MSSVSGIGSTSSTYSAYTSLYPSKRPALDTSTMAETLFSKLDTTGKGYIEESDLASALSSLTTDGSTSSSSSASDFFTQLDSDSDGKVTQDELTTGLAKLADSLNSQFDQMRMDGNMPPPPPPPAADRTSESDSGFTKDELTAQLEEIGSTDSQRSSLISSIVENFDTADTNGDGVVSNAEAMAYDQSTSGSTDSTTASTTASDAQIFQQLVALMHAYGDSTASSLSTAVSTSA